MKKRVTDEIEKVFRPEFINRVNDIIVFRHLTGEDLKQVVVRISMDASMNHALRAETRFWIVEPGLEGGGIGSLLSGTYVGIEPGEAATHLATALLARQSLLASAYANRADLDAEEPAYLHALGNALLRLGRWRESIDAFARLEKLDPML